MDHHVTIRMRHHAATIRHAHTAQGDVVTLAERMHVETLTYAHHPVLASRNSASAKSAAVVTLILSSAPSTSRGAKPACSIAIASSLTFTSRCRSEGHTSELQSLMRIP